MMAENKTKPGISYRDMALKALAFRGGSAAPIIQELNNFETSDANDFVYMLILRQELSIRMIQTLSEYIQKQSADTSESYISAQNHWLQELNLNIRRQEQVFRMQFRRLRKLHRERLFERVLICSSIGAMALFAALCVFYLFHWFE